MTQIVDIVVPVFRGERETRACLESVIESRCATPHELVVIDDASPEPAISAWLDALAAAGRITLVRHGVNRGFVASVNEGMARHPARDVVLLNSDTEVAPGWLDRLGTAARSDVTVATATPFSNNATICSYPRTLVPNPMPEGETTASLDAAFAAANAGRTASITTAVGFCMYITRHALERAGAFDEERYGAGYGEEVDFCMRTARLGLKHVIAADVFVRHVGEVSFAGSGAERRAQAQATVDRLYPEFQVNLREFLADDPLLALRRRADLERLRRSPRPRVLAASTQEAAAARAAGAEPLLLQPAGREHMQLTQDRADEEFSLWFDRSRWDELAGLLRAVGVSGAPPDGDSIPELDSRWLAPPVEVQPARAEDAAPLRTRIAELERSLARIGSSRSWRLTSPLRSAARRLRSLLS